jgi:hypothetical protein
VLCLEHIDGGWLERLLAPYGLTLARVPAGAPIPASYWGEREAGLRGNELFARPDTPLHSVLHEAAHYLCMSPSRRAALERDAGGEELEEAAVCYLQLLLGDALPGIGSEQLANDMDAWGYSFRLGNTRAWFAQDAADARAWLIAHGVILPDGRLSGQLAQFG